MDSREQIEDKILCGQPFRPIEDPDLYYEMMEAAESVTISTSFVHFKQRRSRQ